MSNNESGVIIRLLLVVIALSAALLVLVIVIGAVSPTRVQPVVYGVITTFFGGAVGAITAISQQRRRNGAP